MRLARTTAVVAAVLAASPAAVYPVARSQAAATTAAPSHEQQAEFLKTARVLRSKGLSKGITKPYRLTLTDGTLTHDAVFQSVDEERPIERFTTGRIELNFRDSYQFNIAAYGLARLLGIGDMIPVTVERVWRNQRGSLAWWIEDAWDDEARRKQNLKPPDVMAWTRQQQLMRAFTELVQDTDRNQGNVLITRDWHLWMIDFTRAFRLRRELVTPNTITSTSRDFLARLRQLDRPALADAVGRHLRGGEMDALLARRDLLIAHFERLIASRGEASVLF